ncbi:MAG: hypothetical protein HOA17_03695 [Candidatus Melainabacteria bacterium]|nr:hypothetical protein [Candidatus Melainabacteria bacterium]
MSEYQNDIIGFTGILIALFMFGRMIFLSEEDPQTRPRNSLKYVLRIVFLDGLVK